MARKFINKPFDEKERSLMETVESGDFEVVPREETKNFFDSSLTVRSAKFRATAKKPYTFRLHSGAVDAIREYASARGGHYQTLVDDALVELAARLVAEMTTKKQRPQRIKPR